MTYFEHTKDHELDCQCIYCLDVDPNKSISREVERIIEAIDVATQPMINEEQYDLINKALIRLSVLRRYLPVQELPVKFERQVQEAIARDNE